jgi:acyl-CoA thioesterase FadM
VKFDYEVVRSGDRVVLASGHTIHASLDASLRPRRLPDRVLHALESGTSGDRDAAGEGLP